MFDFQLTDGLQQVDGSHHVGVERLHWFAIGKADERLRRQVEDEIRIHRSDRLRKCPAVTDVADGVRGDAFRKPELIEERRLRWRLLRKPVDFRPEREQPLAKPRSLEPRVPRHEDTPSAIAIENHFQNLVHGAIPSFHSLFRSSYSRPVSMHCQNPSWR